MFIRFALVLLRIRNYSIIFRFLYRNNVQNGTVYRLVIVDIAHRRQQISGTIKFLTNHSERFSLAETKQFQMCFKTVSKLFHFVVRKVIRSTIRRLNVTVGVFANLGMSRRHRRQAGGLTFWHYGDVPMPIEGCSPLVGVQINPLSWRLSDDVTCS